MMCCVGAVSAPLGHHNLSADELHLWSPPMCADFQRWSSFQLTDLRAKDLLEGRVIISHRRHGHHLELSQQVVVLGSGLVGQNNRGGCSCGCSLYEETRFTGWARPADVPQNPRLLRSWSLLRVSPAPGLVSGKLPGPFFPASSLKRWVIDLKRNLPSAVRDWRKML